MQDWPELVAIIEQVRQEIATMMAAGENGTVTIHVGRADLHVEVERKRRHPTVRIERTKAR
jgi:hypothetical protein